MSHPFHQLHHVCIIVRDLDRTMAWYASKGFGPWTDYPKGGRYVEFEVPDKASSDAMRYKCLQLDNVEIQLCEPPPGSSPQRRFLEEHGEGVYHLGFEVPELAAGEAQGRALGLPVLARGRRDDGSGFAYFDTRADAGVVLEIRKTAR